MFSRFGIGLCARAPLGAATLLLVVWCSRASAQAQTPDESASGEPQGEGVTAQHVTVRSQQQPTHVRRDPTVASTVIAGDALKGSGVTSGDVLARVPGVQVTRTGAQSDFATASVRGAEAQQVPVYLAGVRLNDDVSGTADLSSIPLWMMDRVEVFRGNAPAEADRLGPGGAIFFWPRLPRQTRASLGAELGSFKRHAGWASVELGTPRHAGLIALRRSGADNNYPFINDQGQRFDLAERRETRTNADYSQTDAWLLHRAMLSTTARINTVVHAIEREQGVTGLSVVPARYSRATTRRLLGGTSVVLPCGADVGCQLELGSSMIVAGLRVSDPRVELPTVRTRRLNSTGERLTHTARLRLYPASQLAVSASVSASVDNIRVDRHRSRPRRGSRRSFVPKLSTTLEVTDAWSLHTLMAAECHSTRGVIERLGRQAFLDSGTCGVLEPVGRLGSRLLVTPRVELLANVGRYVRVPTLSELYGTAPLVNGNAQLDPEVGWSSDLGLRWSLPRDLGGIDGTLEAFAFARSIDQVIRFRRTSVESLAPFNVASATIVGLEWAGTLGLGQHVQLDTSGTLMDPRETTADRAINPTKNDILPNTARITSHSALSIHTPLPQLAVDRVSVDLRYLHRGQRFDDPAGLTVLAPQNFVDAELAVLFLGGQLTTRLSTRNLFNSMSSDLIGLPVPGRSYHASAEGWF